MSKKNTQSHEAVVFFSDGQMGKQMLLTEFDALLDGVVPIRDFAGSLHEAVYVRLNPQLYVTAAVFFLIPFDARGYPDSGWNIPLNKMADDGIRGPDLGGGPVRLATRSQCPVPGREDDLWDPAYGSSGNTLNQLQDALRENRLGFDVYDQDEPTPAAAPVSWPSGMPPPQAQPMPAMAGAYVQAGAQQADAVMAAMQQHGEQLDVLRQQHRQEQDNLQRQVATLQERLQILENEKLELLNQLQIYGEELEEERRLAQAQLQDLQETAVKREKTLLSEREEQIRNEVTQRTAELEAGLNEQKQRRDQQEEQLNSLRAELTELRRSKLRLLEDGADNFLERLQAMGMKFVVFHPGAGHINVALEEMNDYLDNTEAFVAARAGVSREHYRAWLAHYESPTCQGHASRSALCGKPVPKQLKPAEFVVGIHDRCDVHRHGDLPDRQVKTAG